MAVGLVGVACASAEVTGEDAAQAPTAAPSANSPVAKATMAVPTPLVEERELEDAEKSLERQARLLGWDIEFQLRTISLDELRVSLRRDAIRPIDSPKYWEFSDAAERYDPKEPVIVVDIADDARAYPLSILVNHEIVNDEIGGVLVSVTYCPLCNSSIVFEREVDGVVHSFGTSGMLRNSDLVMWDRETETLWQQLTGEGIVGEQAGKQLTFVPSQVASLDEFGAKWPNGQVLVPSGSLPYLRSSYQGYDDVDAPDPFLFDGELDPRLPATSRVAALGLGGEPVAYSFDLLAVESVLNVESAETPAVIFFDETTESAFRSVERGRAGEVNISGSTTAYLREVNGQILTFSNNGDGRFRDEQTGSIWDRFGEALEGELAGMQLDPVLHGDHFWFAWVAFQPETELVTEISQIEAM